MRRSRLVVPAAAALVAVAAAPMALASNHDLTHRESVLTELDATGEPVVSRIFTQVTVPAGEEVTIPGQSTAGLRTLLGDASADGDGVRFGPGLNRTVADNTAALPVEVSVSYAVDGSTVDPEDVVGHDGEVAVTYTVRNLTAEPTELTLVDGDGETSNQTVEAAVPLVGSLSMTLPPAFRDVAAPGAVVVGDGRGNTVVNWSLLLFAPLGSETAEVTWTAQATDAVVPEASLQVIPVTPSSFGSFGSTQAAYSGAVDSTTELTEGAREIDANLQLLAAGAAGLLDGLVQLRDGAAELAAGLVDANAGAGELAAGLGQANAGAGDLAGGTVLLDDNAAALAAGASEVATGAAGLEAGIEQLNDQVLGASGLPAALAGIEQLEAGTAQIVEGIGSDTTPDTILGGLAQLVALSDSIADPTLKAQFQGGLALVIGGIDNATCDPCGVLQGLGSLQTGLQSLDSSLAAAQAAVEAGLGDPSTPGNTLRYGAAALADGSTELSTGASRLRAQGTAPLEAGAADLTDGIRQLDAGAQQLADGLVTAEDGGQQLADGLEEAVAGGTQLSDGATQLIEEGTSVLAATVSEATVSSSLQLEQVQAVADRGIAGDGLPYPTVEDAEASAVYQFELAGVGTPRGPGTLGRLGAGAVALAAAAGLGAVAATRRSGGVVAAG